MRLLERNNAGEIRLTSFDDDHVPPYAILSHTWGREEVLFKEMVDGTGEGKFGYRKIQFKPGAMACGSVGWTHAASTRQAAPSSGRPSTACFAGIDARRNVKVIPPMPQ